MKFRDQVVVVGIEPFGHLQRRLGRVATGQLEIARQIERLVAEAEAFRNGPQQRRHVEHLVIEGEIADRHQIQAGLQPPVPFAQLATAGGQGAAIQPA